MKKSITSFFTKTSSKTTSLDDNNKDSEQTFVTNDRPVPSVERADLEPNQSVIHD